MVARFVAPFLSFLACVAFCRAQEPVSVTPCDLVNSPQQYAGKVVQVRARISLAFEDFSLAQPGCEDKVPGVWLMYGGDENTPTASTWNDHDRKPGSVVKIDGISVPLVHDANLDLFKRRLTAMRPAMIGDTPCYNCYLYNVTATLTGLFFAAKSDAHQFTGYGHLGCCHLLAIEKVADVDAERSSIPIGAAIQCSRDVKELTQKEAERLDSISASCEEPSNPECSDRFLQMEAVAALWGDALDIHTGYLDGNYIDVDKSEHSGWRTLDRLRYYELSVRSGKNDEAEEVVEGASATRVSCKELTPPFPPSVNLSCHEIGIKTLRSTPFDSEPNPDYSKVQSDLSKWPGVVQSLKEQAATKIDIAARELGLAEEPGTKQVTCDPPMAYRHTAYGGCSWSNATGTMRIDVSLMRPLPPKKLAVLEASSWELTSASARICEVEK